MNIQHWENCNSKACRRWSIHNKVLVKIWASLDYIVLESQSSQV